ncbi:MAG: hypothetical protein RBS77_03230 [Candidatus Moranbacteria bacterium]|jgi:hypothetical protein|nr:hypothetical protein [Candidatus Moranbacteria bacterium]
MSKQADAILKKIEKKKIKPKSKWVFLAKDCLVWGLCGLTTLVGAIAMGVIIFIVNDNDWDIYRQLEKSFFAYFFILMPYFWIIILGIFSFIAYFNYTHTRKGYLLNPYVVIAGSVAVSVILGWALFATGTSEKIDKFFAQKFPYYMNTDMHKMNFWSNPERGLVAGEVIEIKDASNFSLEDFNNKKWKIVGENIIWKDGAELRVGERIKIIGKIKGQANAFRAQEVRPWGCGCSFCDDGQDMHKSCDMSINKDSSQKNEACGFNY